MARILALVDDLFFQARLRETARHVGVEVQTVATGEAFLAEAQRESPALAVVDLNARTAAVEAIATLRAAGLHTPVIGFFSHVQAELAERARAAGCDRLLPRSQFTRELPTILAEVKS